MTETKDNLPNAERVEGELEGAYGTIPNGGRDTKSGWSRYLACS